MEWWIGLGLFIAGGTIGGLTMLAVTIPARQTAFEAGYRLGLVDGRQQMREKIRQWMHRRVDLRGPAA